APRALRLAPTRFGFSWSKLAPDLERFNPAARLKELPRNNFPQVVQALLLMPLFLGAVYGLARDRLEGFLALPLESAESGAKFLSATLMDLFWKAAAVFVVFGSVDLFRQLRRHKRDLRMSKQEIKEEF